MFDTCQTEETLKPAPRCDVSVPMYTSFPIRAVLLSLTGALLGSTLWLLIALAADLERAIPALLVGVFAGAATRIEPWRGRATQLFSLAFTLVGLMIVQYFVLRHAVVTQLVDAGESSSIPMLLSPAATLSVTFGWLRIYPIDTVFWAVAAAAGYLLPAGSWDGLGVSDTFVERMDSAYHRESENTAP